MKRRKDPSEPGPEPPPPQAPQTAPPDSWKRGVVGRSMITTAPPQRAPPVQPAAPPLPRPQDPRPSSRIPVPATAAPRPPQVPLPPAAPTPVPAPVPASGTRLARFALARWRAHVLAARRKHATLRAVLFAWRNAACAEGWRAAVRADVHARYVAVGRCWRVWRSAMEMRRREKDKESRAVEFAQISLKNKYLTQWLAYHHHRHTLTSLRLLATTAHRRHVTSRLFSHWRAAHLRRVRARATLRTADALHALSLYRRALRVWAARLLGRVQESGRVERLAEMQRRRVMARAWRGWVGYIDWRAEKVEREGGFTTDLAQLSWIKLPSMRQFGETAIWRVIAFSAGTLSMPTAWPTSQGSRSPTSFTTTGLFEQPPEHGGIKVLLIHSLSLPARIAGASDARAARRKEEIADEAFKRFTEVGACTGEGIEQLICGGNACRPSGCRHSDFYLLLPIYPTETRTPEARRSSRTKPPRPTPFQPQSVYLHHLKSVLLPPESLGIDVVANAWTTWSTEASRRQREKDLIKIEPGALVHRSKLQRWALARWRRVLEDRRVHKVNTPKFAPFALVLLVEVSRLIKPPLPQAKSTLADQTNRTRLLRHALHAVRAHAAQRTAKRDRTALAAEALRTIRIERYWKAWIARVEERRVDKVAAKRVGGRYPHSAHLAAYVRPHTAKRALRGRGAGKNG
ncbi:hypothetical protein BDK51DRAFT_47277 [Blyttiomyces helicus]|uniref:Sfi1 spindle body domain-containing protein n=1 Tax=Blyttiomyces helicus TaxID=388810 RepID=A0A4P9WH98_9FUNG|nr:hypothetical protein BDK51DRAFT_47277 [Blyttiomyces helicus]|eukprot:RKO92201.1 hypothetical protein BDK51DRAFT_47277 [Blyttiomyces helicus]